MAYESFSVSEVVPAEPERIYAAWLNSEEHTAFTGDAANIEPFVGGKHSSFGGYAVGNTVELQPGTRIVQTWRAEDFPPGTPDSRVEVTLEPTVGGTMVTIFHTEIPPGQSDSYRDSWLKYYLEPLKKYFAAPVAAEANGVSRHRAIKAKPVAPARKPKVKVKVKAKAKVAAKPRRAKPKSKPKATKARRAKPAPKKKAAKAKAKAKPKAKAKAKRPAKKRRR